MSKKKNIIRSSLEILKDSAEQLGKSVSPGEMIKQATGIEGENKDQTSKEPQESEFTKYLKEELGGKKLSEEELEKVRQQAREQDEKDLEKWERVLKGQKTTTPAHMKLIEKPSEKRTYEKTWEDIEREKEEKKRQEEQEEFIEPKGQRRQPGLPWAVKRKKSPEGIGGKMDSKIG